MAPPCPPPTILLLRSTCFESRLKWGIEQILIIFKEDSIVHVIKTTDFYRPQGNVFTPVCDSVHRSGGVAVSVWVGLCPGVSDCGGLCLGGLCPVVSVWRECLSIGSLPRGVSVQGVSVWGDLCDRTVMCGQYASYWNAFLFSQ